MIFFASAFAVARGSRRAGLRRPGRSGRRAMNSRSSFDASFGPSVRTVTSPPSFFVLMASSTAISS
jgi:hypothetical protein